MSSILRRITSRPCLHQRSIVVTSVGVRRSVCEDCGHISFEMERSQQPTWSPISEPDLSDVAVAS